ncbi:hypothetical protein FUSO3_01010, partial [Fusobacterium necrophorum BL]
NISPKTVAEKNISEKTVTQKPVTTPTVSVQSAPSISVKASSPEAPNVGLPQTPTAPTIAVNAPGAITPLGSISVTKVDPVNVSVEVPNPPAPPTVSAPTVTPPETPAGFSPATIPLPSTPNDPDKPDISVFNPIDLAFQGTGFGQGYAPTMSKNKMTLQNFDTYNTDSKVYISTGNSETTWTGGNVTVTSGGSTQVLTSGSYSGGENYITFISDAANHSVTINGDYDMTRRDTTGNGTVYFVSLNPYQVSIGSGSSNTETYNFAGNLTLHGFEDATSPKLLLGFEHQLLAGGGGGSSAFGSGTSIFKNSGTINLASGTNLVGIQIDTEGTQFVTQAQTRNDGTINVNSKNSIAIDYGKYYTNPPNTKLFIGNININGEGNYGLRMKDYHTWSPNYYNATNVTGSNGVITLGGKKNVGIYVGQGMSSGDPIGNMDNLQVKVGGENNIGFLRAGSAGVNKSSITLDASKLGTIFTFAESEATKKSALVRSDFEEVILDKSYTWNSGNLGEGNTFLQAGKTGTVTFKDGNTLTVKANKFYGMTAGNFEAKDSDKTAGAKATNHGKIEITGDDSIAMAADKGNMAGKSNTIENKGELKVTGKGVTGIYNLGIFTQTGSNSKLEVNGEKSLGLYNKNGTMTLDGTATISGTKGAIGIFSDGGSVTSNMGDKLSITSDDTGIASGASQGLGVYSANGANVKINGAKINVTGGSVAIAAVGKNTSNVGSHIEAKNSTINYSGEGYAVYTKDGGKIDISDATINLGGLATGMELDFTNKTITATNTKINVKSNGVTVYNLSNVTTPLKVSTLQSDLNEKAGVTSITSDAGITKYKLASLDGGEVNIDTPISRTDAEGKAGYTFYRRFLAQRTKLNVIKDVTAIMSSTEAKDYSGQVVGLEMNSSKNASSVSETAINLKDGATITANRTDTGNGAIGTFINYGQVNVDSKSKILVEKTNNNKSAVGIYAVNGSQVSNTGTIEVGGAKSVGILGMAYRTDSNGKNVVNEFGNKPGEGLVNITNNGEISLDKNNTIGIFATNNKTGSNATDHTVINKGNISVGNTDKSGTAIGIYGDKVSIKSESGTIKIGESAVGIYAQNSDVGEAGKDLGKIDYNGKNGIGLYLKDNSSLAGTKISLIQTNSGELKGKVGILVDTDKSTETLTTEIDTGSVNDVTAYYSKSSDLTVNANGKINKNSVGIAGTEGKKLIYGNGTFKVGENSTAILGKKNEITLNNNAVLQLTGSKSIGIYSDSDNAAKNALINGKIKFDSTATNAVGTYALNDTNLKIVSTNSVDFGTSKNNIAYYIAGSKFEGSSSSTTLNYAHNSQNIYLYAQGSKASDNTIKGSQINLAGKIDVNPTGTATSTEKAIGLYLNTAVRGNPTEFSDNTLDMTKPNANVSVTNGAIGIYAKNDSTAKTNKILRPNIYSTGKQTVGIYADGNLKLDVANGKISASTNGIGIYGNKGIINIDAEQNVETTAAGTGIFLTNGSRLNGGELNLKNNTSGKAAAGVYYTKGSASSEVVHNTKLSVADGDNLLAMYVDGGINLKNSKDISISKGTGNVASYITGNSNFTNDANISLVGTNFTQAIGIYAANGRVTNNSSKTITVEDSKAGSLSIGMAAVSNGTNKAEITNKGAISAKGDAIGIYVDSTNGASGATNTGTVTAKNDSTIKAIGAYAKGANATFKNTGTISSENIALALENTGSGKITAGKIDLTADNSVAVYSKGSTIDFEVSATEADRSGTVALYADGATKINNKVTTLKGKGGNVGLYLTKDFSGSFGTASEVNVSAGTKTTNIGIYTAPQFSGNINNIKIDQTGEKTVGLYLGDNGTKGSTVTHSGVINVGQGTGIYIPSNSKFTAINTTFNIDKGTGVYLNGGTIDLGATGKAAVNFGSNGGTAIFQNGGTINTDSGLTITGNGSFLALKNGNTTINSLLKVGGGAIGINSTYDKAGTYNLALGSSGRIELNGTSATGIAASTTTGTVNIKNEGTIITTSGNKTVGIFSKGANVENKSAGKIEIGAGGTGIFVTNKGAAQNTEIRNSGKIKLIGAGAIGILGDELDSNKTHTVGEISGTADESIGVLIQNNKSNTLLKDFNIALGTHGRGMVFADNSNKTTITATGGKNKITVGNSTNLNTRGVGITAKNAEVDISDTNVTVGTNSLGLYSIGKTLTYTSGELTSSTGSSILAFADTKGTINLNNQSKLSVGTHGIALGANGGVINANVATSVEVNGANGIGAYIVGDKSNAASISNNFDIKVKQANGIGVYAKGNVNSIAKVSELKGNSSKAYVFDNLTNAATISNLLNLTDTSATGQIGVYAMGSGAGLNLNGISVLGNGNIGVFSNANQNIDNIGSLNIGNSSSKNNSIGIYSDNSKGTNTTRSITQNGSVTVGNNSVGIFGKNTAMNQNSGADVNVGSQGIGFLIENTDAYYNKGNVSVSGNLKVADTGAIGIQTKNADILLSKDLIVGSGDSKGIYSEAKGNINTAGNITVGKNSIGVYKKGTGVETIQTASGKTLIVGDNGYGIFSKGAKVTNNMNISAGVNAIGAYVDGNDLTSTGTVTVGDKGVGLLVKGTGRNLTSTGNISVGSNNSVGLYAEDDANIVQSGNITVADNNGIGAYSKGSGNVSTKGDTTVGKDSIGVYKDGKGTMNINIGSPIQTMNIAEKGYGLYYKGNSNIDSIINSNMNMTLGKEAVGIYGKNTTVNHTGNITVGETTIGSSGFTTPSDNKNSIGIFSDNSNITYKGHMVVDKPLSVGIYGMNGGNIVLTSGSTLDVKNGAYGIMTGKGVAGITVENGATINVDGKATATGATEKNVSFGIAAYSGDIKNEGTINVTNGATGIYVAGTSKLINEGTITIGTGGGKAQDKPGTNAAANI